MKIFWIRDGFVEEVVVVQHSDGFCEKIPLPGVQVSMSLQKNSS